MAKGRGDLLKKGAPAANPGGRGIFRSVKGHVNPQPHGFGHTGGMHQGVNRTCGDPRAHQVGKRK
jgi:hypothetical protein